MIRYFTRLTVLTLIVNFGFFVFFNTAIEASSFPKREMMAEKLKLYVGGTMSKRTSVVPLCDEFCINNSSGFVKLFSFVPVAGKVMTDPISKQGSDDCKSSGNQGKFVGSKIEIHFDGTPLNSGFLS